MQVIVGLLMIIGLIWLICKLWVYIVALGVGLLMAVVVTFCAMVAWAIAAMIIGRKKPTDCGDSPYGWGGLLAIAGLVGGVCSYLVVEKDYFSSFLPQVAIWSGVVGVIPPIFDRIFGSDPPRPAPSPSRHSGARHRRSTARQENRDFQAAMRDDISLTPDGRITRKKSPRAMSDLDINLDIEAPVRNDD
ncbi:MAG: hypothetical protein IJH50_07385 [Kiritimatiellae bacterium]|nr:hypothetical protein [Kiritimatiellia bacterium]